MSPTWSTREQDERSSAAFTSDSEHSWPREEPRSPENGDDWTVSPSSTPAPSEDRTNRGAWGFDGETERQDAGAPWPAADLAELPSMETLEASPTGVAFAAPRRHLRPSLPKPEATTAPTMALLQKPQPEKQRQQASSESAVYVQARPLRLRYARRYLLHLCQYGGPTRIWNVLVVGHRHHGKTSFIDTLVGFQLQSSAAERFLTARTRHQTQPRWTDTRRDELSRGMSLHLASMPLLMSDASGVSQLVNMLDSPGHADFFDEVVVGSMLADVALIVVDSCEGILLGTERAIRLALEASLPMVLVLSQLDRLMLEMRYPPDAVYIKLQGLIEKANAFVEEHRPQPQPYFGPSPPQSNVLFASAKLGTAFSLADVVRQWYLPKLMDGRGNRRLQGARRSTFSVKEQVHDLCAMLWGDHAYDAATGAFTSCTVAALALGTCKRAFVEFVLEPLYKAIALCAISESQRNSIEQLVGYLESFGTDDLDDAAPDVGLIRQRLLQRAASAGPWALLRAVCSILFAEHGELYATLTRFRRTNWPPVEAEEVGTTVLVATHWRSLDGMDTVSVGRVCGRQALEEGQLLFVQERAPNGTETVSRRTYVAQPKVPFGRVWYGIKRASPGCLVLLPQLQPSSIMLRSFALTSGRFSAAMAICLNRLHDSLEQHAMPVYGMAVAPRQGGIDLTPSIPDREILLRGGGNSAEREQICWAIEIVSRTFPGMLVSMPGEAEYRAASVAGVIAGSGELYLDVFLYDVRRLLCQRYEHLSWRCLRTNRTPFVFAFRETISGHSETIRMVARDSHPSKVSSPSLSSTSLDRETDHSNSLVEALHRPLVSMSIEPLYSFSKALQDEFAATDDANMAIVAALPNKVCFSGPERPTKQAILDSPLEMLLECSSTETVRLAESLPLPLRAVYDGLSKAIRQGPLLHAPVQGVRFCVTGVECVCGYAAWDALPSCWVPWSLMRPRLTQVAHEAAWRALAAAPLQILEPCFRVQLVLPPEQVPDTRKKLVGASKQVVIRYQHPIPGTRFVILDARVPARILVPGLEVALRYLSRGQVSIQATADPEVCPGQDCWARVPGNPLDELAADQPQERINTGAENDAWVASWILRTVRKRRGLPATLRDTLCPDSP